jgi:predicted ester cyclase/ketosteroid isomerase-like protein
MKKILLVIPLVFLFCVAAECKDKAAKAELDKFKAQATIEEQNKALVLRYMEKWIQGDTEALRGIFSPDYVWHTSAGKDLSLEKAFEELKQQTAMFSDRTIRNADVFAAGDKVVSRYVFRGILTKDIEGLPTKGKKAEYFGIEIDRIEKGKIVESWEAMDSMSLRERLGLEPEPEENVKQELIRLEKEWADGYVKRDLTVLDRMEAENFVGTDFDGNIYSKAKDLEEVKGGVFMMESWVCPEMKVYLYGETAVVTGRSSVKSRYKGKNTSGQYQWTDTWVNKNGYWQCVANQSSRVTKR